jgi:hypothetical protein
MPEPISYEPMLGITIEQAAKEAVNIANRLDRLVQFKFNDKSFEVSAQTDPKKVVEQYFQSIRKATIELGKTYRTVSGLEARIYAIDGRGAYPVHGAINIPDTGWLCRTWTEHGQVLRNSNDEQDLVEAKKTYKVECWVNVYRDEKIFCHLTEESANDSSDARDRVALVHFEREIEEGEGL